MKVWVLKTVLMAAGISILAVSRGAAQTAIVPAPIVPHAPKTDEALDRERKLNSVIRLRHVRPDLMAFWLDPKNHAAPPAFAFPSEEKLPFAGKSPLQVPAGVDRIVPPNVQNALLVSGTDEGVRSLQEIINFLDRPMRQVEVEALIISIRSENLTGTWADLAAKATNNRPAMGLLGDDEKQWSEMRVRNEARLLASKRLHFINQTAQIPDFGPSSPDGYVSPRLTIPNRAPGDFSSSMPVIPAPQGMAQMPG